MSECHWWMTGEYCRQIVLEREAEIARDRLATLAVGPGRPVRVALADALRAVARRLDGQGASIGERRLATAR